MRNRGAGLDSPEANFIFGGPENESVHRTPDDEMAPYDRATAAVDYVIEPGKQTPPGQILSRRDEAIARIDQAIPNAQQIEADRAKTAAAFNKLSKPKNIDQQG